MNSKSTSSVIFLLTFTGLIRDHISQHSDSKMQKELLQDLSDTLSEVGKYLLYLMCGV